MIDVRGTRPRSVTRLRAVLSLSLPILIALCGEFHARALNLSLTRPDMERALALARWPSSDRERARFHERYIVPVDGARIEYVTVERVEVITEFRRLELIAEAHAGLNDSFGRAGTREVDEALAPWRGRLSIVARLRFDGANLLIPILPDVTVALGGARGIMPIAIHPAMIGGGHAAPSGETLEAIFDASAVGQASRPVLVRWQGKELARVIIDFARME